MIWVLERFGRVGNRSCNVLERDTLFLRRQLRAILMSASVLETNQVVFGGPIDKGLARYCVVEPYWKR